MTLFDGLLVLVASLAGGTINGIAGGGTFFTFSALIGTGLPPVIANATSAMILTPASFASTFAYLPEIRRYGRRYVPLAIASMIGGLSGALLLLFTPSSSFRTLIPFFLGFATLLFATSPLLLKCINRVASGPGSGKRRLAGIGMQFVVSIYGGYFGAGMGIIMLAALALAEGDDYHFINAAKNLCSLFIQGFALIALITAGIVAWPHAIIGLIGGVCGGYIGVKLARRVPTKFIRWIVVSFGTILTLRFALA
jgi:uncharacterized membrane protein YfcA